MATSAEPNAVMEETILPDGTLSLSLPFGCSIRTAATEAVKRAQEVGLPVQLVFNEFTMVVTEKNHPETIERVYQDHLSALAAPTAAAFEAAIKDKLASDVGQAQDMLADLPRLIADEDALVAWIGAFALLNLATGFDLEALADRLEAAGYVAEDMTAQSQPAPTKRNWARYIVGQAIAMLRRGHALHPVLCAHAEKHREAITEAVAVSGVTTDQRSST